jgi:hypothetical protein
MRKLASCLVLLVVLVIPSTSGASHQVQQGLAAGAFEPWGFNDNWFEGTPQALADIQFAGAIQPDHLSTNRFKVEWKLVEPNPPINGAHDYKFERTDPIEAAMQAQNVTPILMLSNAPEWARPPGATQACGSFAVPPDASHLDHWKDFVSAAVTEYPNVRAVEIWNEPNFRNHWCPTLSPEYYSTLLRKAHEAVRGAGSSVDVLVGGLSNAPNDAPDGRYIGSANFLRRVYQSPDGCKCYFEGVGTHPYPVAGQVGTNGAAVAAMWHEFGQLETVMANFEDEVPLWITEVGISTDPLDLLHEHSVTRMQQGPRLLNMYASLHGHPEIEGFLIHSFRDLGFSGQFATMGLITNSGGVKPAYCQLGQAIGTPPGC